MARVISGVLQPTTTTPGQPIAHFAPDTGTELLATQCSAWLKTWNSTAGRLGVAGFYEESDCKLEVAFYGCSDYGQGASLVVPLEGIVVQSGGQQYSWALVPGLFRQTPAADLPFVAVVGTYWHGAFFFQ